MENSLVVLHLQMATCMYVRGYLQGNENGRVVTIVVLS
jgi:hypothetical protein